MTTRPRVRRDLSWPVPATDLQDLDVLEIVQGDDGRVLWRVDEQPAAAPQECREALLKRRHGDDCGEQPDTLVALSSMNAEEAADLVPPLPDQQGASDAPDIHEFAAIMALTDMPDVPVVLDATELLDAAEPAPADAALLDASAARLAEDAHEALPIVSALDVGEVAEAPPIAALSTVDPTDLSLPAQPSDAFDMAAAMQWREDFESFDAPVLHVVQTPTDVHVPPPHHAAPTPANASMRDLPPVVTVRPAFEPDEVMAPALAREWPQAAEFVDALDFVEPTSVPQATAIIESPAPAEPPEMEATPDWDSPPLPSPVRFAPTRRPILRATALSAWVATARQSFDRSQVAPAERLALVGGGMLMGLLFAVVGGPRGTMTAPVAATATAMAQLAGPTAAEPVAAASLLATQRLVPVSHSVGGLAGPLPSTVPTLRAEAPGARAAVTPSAPRPHSQAAPAVLGAIQRYAVAYNRQDARATTAVWPTADQKALIKTFSGLREQRLTLQSCTTAVTGNKATASCYGTRRYRPRVGDSSTRIQQGRWRFGLQRADGTWLIASVDTP